MTLKTWLEEFYPERADTFRAEQSNPENKLAATEHSLLKWRGLTVENLKKHDVRVTSRREVVESGKGDVNPWSLDQEYLGIDSYSCALCQLTGDDCSRCPIVEARGHRCDVRSYEQGNGMSEWSTFMINTDPKPMIALLEKTREYLLAEIAADNNPTDKDTAP